MATPLDPHAARQGAQAALAASVVRGPVAAVPLLCSTKVPWEMGPTHVNAAYRTLQTLPAALICCKAGNT